MLRVVLLPTIVLASSCKGILVSDDCWVLSQPAQSCADLCGGASRVDAETTVGGATTRMVVSALEAKYGLHDTSKDSLDAPCGWPPYLAEGEVQIAPVFGEPMRDFQFESMGVGVDQSDRGTAGLQDVDDLLEDQGEGFFGLFGIRY